MEWHGYEQHPDAHPDRPWWHRTTCVISGTAGWERSPDRYFAADPAEMDECVHSYEDLVAETTPELGRIDREHTLPCPPPRCGQVWVWPKSGRASMIFAIEPPNDVECKASCVFWREEWDSISWPPPRAVLVAGPGSPWMDTREVKP